MSKRMQKRLGKGWREVIEPMKWETKLQRFREGKTDLHITGEEWYKLSQKGDLCGIVGCPNLPKHKCPTCGNHYCNVHREVHQYIHPMFKRSNQHE